MGNRLNSFMDYARTITIAHLIDGYTISSIARLYETTPYIIKRVIKDAGLSKKILDERGYDSSEYSIGEISKDENKIVECDDDRRLKHDREVDETFNRGYQSCLDDIRSRDTSYNVPMRFIEYLEATRDNDKYIDKPIRIQHMKDYETYIKHCPIYPKKVIEIENMIDIISKCFGLTYPGARKDGARVILNKEELKDILLMYTPKIINNLFNPN